MFPKYPFPEVRRRDNKSQAANPLAFFTASKSLWMMTAAMKLKDVAPWRKSYDKLSMLKSRDVTLPTKVCLVKDMVFPLVMYGCESWTIKKPEHWRIDAFELWCWRRLLRVPWTARRSNLTLKEIGLEYSRTDAEAPKLWSPDVKSWLIGKTLMLGKMEGRRRRGWQGMSLSKLWEIVKDRKAWHVYF